MVDPRAPANNPPDDPLVVQPAAASANANAAIARNWHPYRRAAASARCIDTPAAGARALVGRRAQPGKLVAAFPPQVHRRTSAVQKAAAPG